MKIVLQWTVVLQVCRDIGSTCGVTCVFTVSFNYALLKCGAPLQGTACYSHPHLLDDWDICSDNSASESHPHACSVWSIPVHGCGISEGIAVL
jgi:hypothetical protein